MRLRRENNLANFNSRHLPVLLATSGAGHLTEIQKEVLAENHQTEGWLESDVGFTIEFNTG